MAIFTWCDGIVPQNMVVKQVWGLIFSSDGRLLLKVENNAGVREYSLAGGRPEACDNDFSATLKRETLEEVNITITEPIIVGYQEVDEQDSSPLFAQVRMTAMINNIGEIRPDIDNGKIYERLLVHPLNAAELLNWGETGYAQMNIASDKFAIKQFSDFEEYI